MNRFYEWVPILQHLQYRCVLPYLSSWLHTAQDEWRRMTNSKKNGILWYSVWGCLCYMSLCVATQWLWCYLQSVDDFAGMLWLCIEFASREIGVLNEICSKVRVDTSILWCHHVIKTIKWNEKNKNAFTKFDDEILVQKKYLMIWIST